MSKLKVLESADAEWIGREFELQDDESWIGRAAEAAVSIPDAAISRRHARIDRKAEGFVLVDNGSANGTFLNDHQVAQAILKEGDRIRIGRTTFAVQGLPDPDGTMILERPAVPPVRMEEKATVVNYSAAAEPVLEVPPPPFVTRPVAMPPAPPVPRPVPPPPARPAPPPAQRLPPPPAAAAPVVPVVSPVPPAPAPVAVPRPPAPAQATPRPAVPVPAPHSVPPPPAAMVLPAATLAGFWIRFAAYLIDSVILSVILVPLYFAFGMLFLRSRDQGAALGLMLVLQLLLMVISLGYILYFWSTSGATPGKKLLGLKIVRIDGVQPIGIGTACIRLLGYLVSSIILYIGFLMIGFSADKRGLHDKIAKTRVIRFG